ncbi:TetR/AcrR family transcriptional regulator [Bacillaceae bacterium SIJ1]|uniref:TetR/AcrR family transcriptional regulator n=1 Tax=Litoribacterium kuwaitense TaxID=1398745 RepID=UPI0013EC33B8|nr:TetR/AcrR family transcriptional regulator [Litoribacterium kuwaitense]NGP46469.1 TetR/AcrR family transcriptional regulator [Litoribacterium kuwaitense]
MRDVKDPDVRRAEIMKAALRLFSEKGYLQTTTQNIIEEVNISRGLLYYHFKNKEDILYCLVETYSEPLLRRLSAIAYHEQTSAVEKVRTFLEATIISPDSVTTEMVELQKTVDLEQNRYLTDRFSHRFATTITTYFAHMIEQGNSEGVFDVTHPLETASFLMTGYVFVSNDVKVLHIEIEKMNEYVSAFKALIEGALRTKEPIFSA